MIFTLHEISCPNSIRWYLLFSPPTNDWESSIMLPTLNTCETRSDFLLGKEQRSTTHSCIGSPSVRGPLFVQSATAMGNWDMRGFPSMVTFLGPVFFRRWCEWYTLCYTSNLIYFKCGEDVRRYFIKPLKSLWKIIIWIRLH